MGGLRALGFLALVVGAPAAQAASLTLYDGKTVAAVAYDATDAAPLAKAADMLAHDLDALSGRRRKSPLASTVSRARASSSAWPPRPRSRRSSR